MPGIVVLEISLMQAKCVPTLSATDTAYQTTNTTKDAPGRQAYLQQEYGAKAGRYNYTKGQQKLDNLLIEKTLKHTGNSKRIGKRTRAKGKL
jgi:hypothetical protein